MVMQPLDQDLWQELKDALALPQTADLKRLCHLFDWAIAQLPENQQLDAAGKAIEQIAAVYVLKADWLMATWEVTDEALAPSLPVLATEAIEVWIRQSMLIDLDAFVEQPISKRRQREQKSCPTDSIAAVVDQASVLEMIAQMKAEPNPEQMIRRLAGEEDPAKWSAAIMQWLQEYVPEDFVCLPDLCSGLDMPWVEVLLGLLLGGFVLEQRGDFYSNSDVWVALAC